MPQQHPGRLQILVVDAHCKRRLFSTKTPTDPDELARRFCTPDNCRGGTTRQPISVPTGACSRQPLPLAQGQQLPPSASTGLAVVNTTKTKDLVKTGGGRVLFS